MPLRTKVSELLDLKDRRSRQREIRDLEERVLLDSLDDTERNLRGSPMRANRGKLNLSKHRDLRQIQVDYERLRERERQIQAELGPYRTGRRSVYSRNTDSSMSIHLPDESDLPRYNPNSDPKLQMLAETHGRQMEMLQGRNRDLERQREEIRRRLQDLGRRPVQGDDSTNNLLQELREQEARNQRLLDELRRQLNEARQPINIITERQQIQQAPNKSYVYPVYYGSSLVAEISAIRQAYIQNCGTDPEVLAQLSQMQAEAQAIEDQLRNAQQKKPKDKRQPDYLQGMMAMEMENERLQRELILLQEQNLHARNRRKDDREDELEREIRRLQQEYLRRMHDLQRDIERMRNEVLYYRREPYPQEPTKIILQQQPAPAAPAAPAPPPPPPQQMVQQRLVEVEQMQPYDQYFSPRVPAQYLPVSPDMPEEPPRQRPPPAPKPYMHTWVSSQHRKVTEFDPQTDLTV